MKQKLVSLFVLSLLVGTIVPIVGLSGDAGDSPKAGPEMLIWEAYAKGHISVTMLGDLRFRVSSSIGEDVKVSEHVWLLSPHPLDTLPGDTTQDGVLPPPEIVPANGNLYYDVYDQYATKPYWWCSENYEYTEPGISVTLGGEIMTYALQHIMDLYKGDLGNLQNAIWAYQRDNPTVVVGKTPLWKSIPDNQQNEIDVTLAVTNTGFVGSNDVIVTDTLPPGYTYNPSSFSHQPESIVVDPSGNTIFKWRVSLDAAVWVDPNMLDPTDYDWEIIKYTMRTPILNEGRHFLPRAFVDQTDDGLNDADSAKPLLEVYHVNQPPVADAGGFYYVAEGAAITFDASASVDPDGDPLQYRWDLDSDGTWDTGWSNDPTIDLTMGDDTSGMVKVEVTDGEDSSAAFAYYLFENVAPTLDSLNYVVSTTYPRTIGYWKRQCWDWLPPSPDHVGILPEYVQFISSGSQVFSAVQSKDDVCFYLEEVDHSVMLEKAKQQLIAVWLNVASGNLSFATEVELPIFSGTVVDFIDWAETVILNNDDAKMEKAKDVADYINNGIGVEIATVTFTASATDLGSDDVGFTWDFGEGTIQGPHWVYNDGVGPDPEDSPDGTYPFTASNMVSAGYPGLGTYTVQLTLEDDDTGKTTHTITVVIG